MSESIYQIYQETHPIELIYKISKYNLIFQQIQETIYLEVVEEGKKEAEEEANEEDTTTTKTNTTSVMDDTKIIEQNSNCIITHLVDIGPSLMRVYRNT